MTVGSVGPTRSVAHTMWGWTGSHGLEILAFRRRRRALRHVPAHTPWLHRCARPGWGAERRHHRVRRPGPPPLRHPDDIGGEPRGCRLGSSGCRPSGPPAQPLRLSLDSVPKAVGRPKAMCRAYLSRLCAEALERRTSPRLGSIFS